MDFQSTFESLGRLVDLPGTTRQRIPKWREAIGRSSYGYTSILDDKVEVSETTTTTDYLYTHSTVRSPMYRTMNTTTELLTRGRSFHNSSGAAAHWLMVPQRQQNEKSRQRLRLLMVRCCWQPVSTSRHRRLATERERPHAGIRSREQDSARRTAAQARGSMKHTHMCTRKCQS